MAAAEPVEEENAIEVCIEYARKEQWEEENFYPQSAAEVPMRQGE